MVYTSEYFFEICKVALTYIYLRDDLREQKVFWLSFFYLDFCFSKMSRSQSFADTTTMITVVQAISDQIRLFRLVLKFFEVFFTPEIQLTFEHFKDIIIEQNHAPKPKFSPNKQFVASAFAFQDVSKSKSSDEMDYFGEINEVQKFEQRKTPDSTGQDGNLVNFF